VIKNVLPPGLSGLMFIAIIAALQSSIDSGINSTSLMVTRDIRQVLFKNADPDHDLRIGRWITLIILSGGMLFAPFIGEMGGIYFLIQTLLSLFQGPLLALLVLGALSRHPTPKAGLWTLLSGVVVAGSLTWSGINMLYVAFTTFCYAIIVLWGVSYVTPDHDADLTNLVFRRA
jgi:SSS family solute:Na+ symporter